jgi:hypothetical protein
LKFNFFSTDCDRKQTPDETVNVEWFSSTNLSVQIECILLLFFCNWYTAPFEYRFNACFLKSDQINLLMKKI